MQTNPYHISCSTRRPYSMPMGYLPTAHHAPANASLSVCVSISNVEPCSAPSSSHCRLLLSGVLCVRERRTHDASVRHRRAVSVICTADTHSAFGLPNALHSSRAFSDGQNQIAVRVTHRKGKHKRHLIRRLFMRQPHRRSAEVWHAL